MRITVKKHLTVLPIAAAALLAVSGCAPGLPSIPNPVENIVEQVTGGNVDVGSNVTVPAGWPNLPLPQGELVAALAVDKTYSLTYKLPNEAAAEALRAELTAAGFASEGEADYGGLKTYILTDGALSVTLGVLIDGGDVSLTYSSTPKG